jgi:hypothetical protein
VSARRGEEGRRVDTRRKVNEVMKHKLFHLNLLVLTSTSSLLTVLKTLRGMKKKKRKRESFGL